MTESHPPPRPKVLWVNITPVFLPAVGGGAIQADTIARALAADGHDVMIVTEMHPGQQRREILAEVRGCAWVERTMPFRAGRARKDWRLYAAYIGTNLGYLQLPGLIRKTAKRGNYDAVGILLHTSFLYKPNLLEKLLPTLRRAARVPTIMMAELQDAFWPDSKIGKLLEFDRIVTTSQGVRDALASRAPGIADRIRLIPMPFEPPEIPADAYVDKVLDAYGLNKGRYLFNPNGLTAWKHCTEMREAIPILRAMPGFEDIILVTAGRERDRTPMDTQAERDGHVRFLGPVLPAEALALMRGAMMTLVLSDKEAISRAAVEAMWVGGKVILPDLAEYRSDCASHICRDLKPEAIARQVARLVDLPMPGFKFDKHRTACFLPFYRDILNEALTEQRTGTRVTS